jgi:eukaryotic-like serine/threonine-protein kinase
MRAMKQENDPGAGRDRNLLFGVIAVQLQLISAQDLASAAAAWATEPGTELGAVLIKLGLLDEKKRRMIEQMLELQVREHDDDAGQTLRTLSFDPAYAPGVEAVLQSLPAPDGGTLHSFGGEVSPSASATGPDPLALLDDREHVTLEQKGRYRVKREAGHGAIGQVMVAMDLHIGREVAVKELLGDQGGWGSSGSGRAPSRASSAAAQRFLREARITGQLEHPGIVPVHEIGKRPDGVLYYTMKLVRGQTLADKLKELRGPGEGSAAAGGLSARLKYLPHFLDLCQSMAYAHSKGVIHRDLKPANVMVGEFGETVVLDWGLAKVRGLEDVRVVDLEENLRLIKEATAGDTVQGRPIGTPAYMSPEQADGDVPNIDERSDVWSLGAILYEVLTGHPPFTGHTAYEVMGKVLREPLTPVGEAEPHAPAELGAIAEKCLRKDRAARYAHAGELAADVHHFQSGGLVSAYEYSMAALARRWVQKRWPVVATAVLALVALVALGAWSYLNIRAQKDRAERREQEARINLAAADDQMGLQAEKKQLWADARLYYAESLTLHDGEPARSGYYTAWLQPIEARLIRSIAAHQYSIMSAAWSPDGKAIVSGSCAEKNSGICARGELALWDAQTGANLRTIAAHEDYVRVVAFAPDGRTVLSASWDNTLKIWSAASGECLHTLTGHDNDIYAAAFSPDGTLIASAGMDGTVRIWSAATGETVHVIPFHGFGLNALAFTPDGQSILTGGGDANIEQWSTATWERTRVLSGHSYIVEALAVSPDGKYAASGSWDKTVKLWSLETGLCVATMLGHEDRIFTVAFSPDGRLLLSGGLDKIVRVWSVPGGENVLTLGANADQIQSASFSPEGGRVLTSSSDHTLKVWEVGPNREVHAFPAADKILWSAALDPAGKYIATVGSDDAQHCAVRLWSLVDGRTVRSFEPQGYPYLSLAFAPDGRQLLTGGCGDSQGYDCFRGELKLWDVETGTVTKTLAGHDGVIDAVALGPGGRMASASCRRHEAKRGCIEGEIKIWDLANGESLRTFSAHGNVISGLAFTPDGRRLLSAGGLDATLKLWDPDTGQCFFTMSGHTNLINAIAISPDGKLAASASFDNTVKLWDLQGGVELKTLRGHEVGVKSAAFSPDGKYLLSGGFDHDLKIWTVPGGVCVLTLRGHRAAISAAAFSPDASRIVAADEDKLLTVWPMNWDLLTQDPLELRKLAQRDTGLELEGFKLIPLRGQ